MVFDLIEQIDLTGGAMTSFDVLGYSFIVCFNRLDCKGLVLSQAVILLKTQLQRIFATGLTKQAVPYSAPMLVEQLALL